MKNIEFNYVKEVAGEKSFSLAAKKLGISQPALSSYINKLEKKLGVTLFDRSISPIEITEIGRYYLDYADTVLDAADKFENIISDLSELKKGTIHIGSTSCFSTGYLPEAISRFNRKYPEISFDILEGKVPQMKELCLVGAVDMVLSDSNINIELFEKEDLFNEQILMCVPKDNPVNDLIKQYAIPIEAIAEGNLSDKKYNKVDLKLLKEEKFILLNEDQPIRHIVDRIFELSGYKPNEIMEVPQTTTGLAMTVAGIGISFVAESTIKYSNFDKHPIYYKIGKVKDCSRMMCIAYKRNKYISKACRLFIDELKDTFNK